MKKVYEITGYQLEGEIVYQEGIDPIVKKRSLIIWLSLPIFFMVFSIFLFNDDLEILSISALVNLAIGYLFYHDIQQTAKDIYFIIRSDGIELRFYHEIAIIPFNTIIKIGPAKDIDAYFMHNFNSRSLLLPW